ncbi:hypothetical protein [Cereibacter johrii]|uniref:hypothetical protein n=1 Tax=Cereibacter johrii TaxID=445629 RepID=UPI00114CB5B6|nr:hypothetical protein [Cereibacter johrii]
MAAAVVLPMLYFYTLRNYLKSGDIKASQKLSAEQGARAEGLRRRVSDELLDDFTMSFEKLWAAEEYIKDMPTEDRKGLGREAPE